MSCNAEFDAAFKQLKNGKTLLKKRYQQKIMEICSLSIFTHDHKLVGLKLFWVSFLVFFIGFEISM
jgi:hypothetical protein